MKCDDCGKCCKSIMFEIFNDDMARWVKYHGIKIKKEIGKKWAIFDISCKKLKNNKCVIYKKRPEMCKNFWCDKERSRKC